MKINYETLEKNANPGAFSRYDMQVLVPELLKLRPGDVYLEVGVDRGRSLSVAAEITDPKVMLVGIDINYPKDLARFLSHNARVNFMQGDSVKIAKEWNKDIKINLLFIDGDHSYEGCKRDIEAWVPHMVEHGTILFHDCDETSPGVVQAVFEYYNTHKCQSINLFKSVGINTSMAGIIL